MTRLCVSKLCRSSVNHAGIEGAVRTIVGLAAISLVGLANAQDFPNRPVTLLVPFAVGSSTDIMTRLVAKGLNDRFKTGHFIVENKPGAGGSIATTFVARAKPDGYMLIVGTGTTHTQNPWLMKNLSYDPVGDFEAVAGIGGVPLGVLVANDSPAKTMEDLRNLIGADPGKHAYGTAFGMGTVCGETIKQNFKLDLVQVAYKSSPQALTDLAGGRIVVMCSDFNSAMGPIRNKQVRALAVTTHKRSLQLPDVPAITEIFPGFPEMVSWVGVFAPKGTPAEIVQRLAPAILEVTGSAEFLKTLEPNGFQRLALSETALTSFVKEELVKWEKLIKKSGIEPQ